MLSLHPSSTLDKPIPGPILVQVCSNAPGICYGPWCHHPWVEVPAPAPALHSGQRCWHTADVVCADCYRPEPDAPGEARLPMADWIEVQASLVRLLDSDLASWLARKIEEIAIEARVLRATTPDEFDDRAEVMAEAGSGSGSSWRLTEAEWAARVRFDDAAERADQARRDLDARLEAEYADRCDSDRMCAGVGCL